MSFNAMRSLENKLANLQLSKESGENIESFSNKVKDVSDRLNQGISYKPADLPVLVGKTYIHCSVEAFRLPVLTIYDAVSKDTTVYTHVNIIKTHC